MTLDRRTIARRLADAAVATAPRDHRVWAEAIRAEVEHLPDARAIGFALGGLATAGRLRIGRPALVTAAARWGLTIAAFAWALLQVRLGGRLAAADAVLPAALAYAGAGLYLAGAGVTLLLGLRMTAWLVLPVLGAAAVYALGAGALTPDSPYLAFYQAIAIEQSVVLAIALVVAMSARAYAVDRSRTTF